MLTITAVSYLNTLPFVYGITHSGLLPEVRLKLMVPSACVTDLTDGQTDIALIPVGALPSIANYQLVTDYCIGSEGAVKTVLLLSDAPLSKIKRIFLDTDSRTSVKLVSVLARSFWKIAPEWLSFSQRPATPELTDAFVVIGDKAFSMGEHFRYAFDLSAEWMKMSGMPFVFAVWVSKKPVAAQVEELLNRAFRFGIEHIPLALENYDCIEISKAEAFHYLNSHIRYTLDSRKKAAMLKFLRMIQ